MLASKVGRTVTFTDKEGVGEDVFRKLRGRRSLPGEETSAERALTCDGTDGHNELGSVTPSKSREKVKLNRRRGGEVRERLERGSTFRNKNPETLGHVPVVPGCFGQHFLEKMSDEPLPSRSEPKKRKKEKTTSDAEILRVLQGLEDSDNDQDVSDLSSDDESCSAGEETVLVYDFSEDDEGDLTIPEEVHASDVPTEGLECPPSENPRASPRGSGSTTPPVPLAVPLSEKRPPEAVSSELKKGNIFAQYSSNNICVSNWRDKREVLAISSEFGHKPVKVKNKRGQEREKPRFMKGYDRQDQMLSYYSPAHKTLRWYKKLGIHIFHLMLNNAYLLFKNYGTGNEKLDLHDFQLEICAALLPEPPPPPTIVPPSFHVHLPTFLPSAKGSNRTMRKRCKKCMEDKNIRKDSMYGCPSCQGFPGFCLEPCFRSYHQYK
ncbi:hypothetical protein GE061_011740 [Apolygus lucorum]|uniref:PiggyBac transposable element-derived protein domain-containing protein n=1 Tax=Apolygus lucorum TaxID=248454 RepID=A0A8S9Y0B5_APOLU|nr:hypothetical protein GE061_011740 [Apolygus lucorum]